MAHKMHIHNGVQFTHVFRRKWQFTGTDKSGQPLTTFQLANGVEQAKIIAGHIGGSLKRKAGEVDSMAKTNISKVALNACYCGNNLSISHAQVGQEFPNPHFTLMGAYRETHKY